VVAENGSTDDTAGIVERASLPGVRLLRVAGKGKGLAIREAARASEADAFGFIDADLSADPAAIAPMLERLASDADLVIGVADGGTPAAIGFSLAQQGDTALDAPLRAELRREESRIEAGLVPRALLAWIEAADATTIPPITGIATLPAVEFDGIRLEGIHVEITEAPAADDTPVAPPVSTERNDG